MDEQLQLVTSQLPKPVRKRLKLEDLPPNAALMGAEPDIGFVTSIKTYGQQTPVWLEVAKGGDQNEQGTGYIVAAGRRRIKALRIIGEKTILCDVYPEGSNVVSILTVLENEHRVENPATTYVAITKLMVEHKEKDPREIGRALGLPVQRVDRLMRISTLIPALEQAFIAGKISVATAFELTKLPKGVQKSLAKTLEKGGKLTTKMVKEARQVRVQKEVAGLDDELFGTPDAAEAEGPSPVWPLIGPDDDESEPYKFGAREDIWAFFSGDLQECTKEAFTDAAGIKWRVNLRVTVDLEELGS